MAGKKDAADKKEDIDTATLLRFAKKSLINSVNAGEPAPVQDLERIVDLEERLKKLTNPAPPAEPPDDHRDDEHGIPDRLRIRRRYSMTSAAKDQRKRAANSKKKSESMKGNKNAWKTGEFAQGLLRRAFRPCLSTCPHYPCGLVSGGQSEPGEMCLDKVRFARSLEAVQTAIRSGRLEDLKDLAAVKLAGAMEVVDRLIGDILEDGTLIKSEKFDKMGGVIGHEIVPHPSLFSLHKLFQSLGLSLDQFMITPLAVSKQKIEGKKAKTLADLMSGNFDEADESDESGY